MRLGLAVEVPDKNGREVEVGSLYRLGYEGGGRLLHRDLVTAETRLDTPAQLKARVIESLPISTSRRMATAVIGFEMLAMRNRARGMTSVLAVGSAYPKPRE